MTSKSLDDLRKALADVDGLVRHARSFSRGKRGAPASVEGVTRPGRPFTHAAVVMLAGATEAFFESLALEPAGKLPLTDEQSKDIKEVVDRMHGIGPGNVHGLYAALGCPFVLDELGWKGLRKGSVRKRLAALRNKRNKIAHGKAPQASQVKDVVKDQHFVESLAAALEKRMEDRIAEVTGSSFTW